MQATLTGRGGYQPITGRHNSPESLSGGCELAPDSAGFKIDRKHPVTIVALQRLQPDLEESIAVPRCPTPSIRSHRGEIRVILNLGSASPTPSRPAIRIT